MTEQDWSLFVDVAEFELPKIVSHQFLGVQLLVAGLLNGVYARAKLENERAATLIMQGPEPPTGLAAKRLFDPAARAGRQIEKLDGFVKQLLGHPGGAIEPPPRRNFFIVDVETGNHFHNGMPFRLSQQNDRLLVAFAMHVAVTRPERDCWETLQELGDDGSDSRELKIPVKRLRSQIAKQTGFPAKDYREIFKAVDGGWRFNISSDELVLRRSTPNW